MNVATLQLSDLDRAELTALEEDFWRAETREALARLTVPLA